MFRPGPSSHSLSAQGCRASLLFPASAACWCAPFTCARKMGRTPNSSSFYSPAACSWKTWWERGNLGFPQGQASECKYMQIDANSGKTCRISPGRFTGDTTGSRWTHPAHGLMALTKPADEYPFQKLIDDKSEARSKM